MCKNTRLEKEVKYIHDVHKYRNEYINAEKIKDEKIKRIMAGLNSTDYESIKQIKKYLNDEFGSL